MHSLSCHILEHTRLSETIYRLTLQSLEISESCRAGQFVHVRVADGREVLWRRPFSIHRVDRNRGSFEILYRVVGEGTTRLCRKQPGERLDLLGPLGNGFDPEGRFRLALLVAGGVGCADLFFLSDALLERGKRIVFLWGVRSRSELFDLDLLRTRGIDVRTCTEDGSDGRRGLAVDLLKDFLSEGGFSGEEAVGFVCGPKGMIRAVQPMAERTEFPWQVSLEEKMACGVGVCQGCAVRRTTGAYAMVCSDGPVFDLRTVVLDG